MIKSEFQASFVIVSFVSHPSEADCWVSEQIIFTVWGCQPHAHPLTWRTRLFLFVWVITLELSGMGGPTSSIRYRQHSSRVHMTTQAPPQRRSSDAYGGRGGAYNYTYAYSLYVICTDTE